MYAQQEVTRRNAAQRAAGIAGVLRGVLSRLKPSVNTTMSSANAPQSSFQRRYYALAIPLGMEPAGTA